MIVLVTITAYCVGNYVGKYMYPCQRTGKI